MLRVLRNIRIIFTVSAFLWDDWLFFHCPRRNTSWFMDKTRKKQNGWNKLKKDSFTNDWPGSITFPFILVIETQSRSTTRLCQSCDGQLVKAIFYWKISGSGSFGIFTNFPICCSSSIHLSKCYISVSFISGIINFLSIFQIKQAWYSCIPSGMDLKYLPFSDNVPF